MKIKHNNSLETFTQSNEAKLTCIQGFFGHNNIYYLCSYSRCLCHQELTVVLSQPTSVPFGGLFRSVCCIGDCVSYFINTCSLTGDGFQKGNTNNLAIDYKCFIATTILLFALNLISYQWYKV